MLWLNMDRSLDVALKVQVYEQIRTRILRGELKAGYKLPPSRELATHLGVSRNVVVDAYEQLLAEGYVEGKQGSGTYVTKGAVLEQDLVEKPLFPVTSEGSQEDDPDVIDFRTGIPALDRFPRKEWGKLAKEVCEEAPNAVFGYGVPEGRVEFRYELSRYLRRTRGVYCHPDQLVITSGATQGFSVIAKLLIAQNKTVVLEDPITQEIQTIANSAGGVLHPVPVDLQGLKTDCLPWDITPGFVFVTPSHQFPLGVTLPIQRRIQLIQYARTKETYIVEDDYDSEFRYSGEPIRSLQGLDPDRVIYVGTFSKILSPALRMGYLILPPALIQRCRELKWLHDLHTPALDQLILSRFIHEGRLERHIRKMRKLYEKRRDFLKLALEQSFGDRVSISGDSTGLHLIAEFKDMEWTEDIQRHVQQHQVKVYPVEVHAIRKGKHLRKVILGFSNLSREQIEEGVRRLKIACQYLP
ncbi:GntR family transcriptional regulator [Fischerella thermalis CCMEE 5273]|nr:GntR family transcriptional regulator [Fischerella thermalis CCMEE 5273]